MAHRTISDDEFIAIAFDLFRTGGFEGVSIKQLADATGLEKASIYYRYPGGKDEVAQAVVQGMADWLQQNIFDPLNGSGTPRRRIQHICEQLRACYGDGRKSCIIDLLSLPNGSSELRSRLKATLQSWIDAFAAIARESGLTPAVARARAEEAIVRIEGSLVLTRALDDNLSFERTLKQLPDLLTVA